MTHNSSQEYENRETCTCPLGGARTLILVAGIAFDGWIFFLSSKVLSTGFCHCEGLFSSISLEGDFGLVSFATHLLSSYLQICAANKSEESASPGAHNKEINTSNCTKTILFYFLKNHSGSRYKLTYFARMKFSTPTLS